MLQWSHDQGKDPAQGADQGLQQGREHESSNSNKALQS